MFPHLHDLFLSRSYYTLKRRTLVVRGYTWVSYEYLPEGYCALDTDILYSCYNPAGFLASTTAATSFVVFPDLFIGLLKLIR